MRLHQHLLFSLCVFIMGALAVPNNARAQKKKRVITVGIVVDGRGAVQDPLLAKIQEQAKGLIGSQIELRFPKDKQLNGEFDANKISAHLDSLLADPSVSLVLASGIVAGSAVASKTTLSKPVLVPFVLDRDLQKMPFKKGTSGRKNLSYLEFPWSIPRDIEVFKEVANVDSMTFLVEQYILDAIPGLAERAKVIAAENNVTMTVLGVGESIGPVLAKLETKAAYLTPLSRLPNDERLRLYQELNSRHIATFSILGEQEVRAGVLVGRRPVTSSDKIARRVALHIVRIARGDAPESLRVSMQLPERLMINMKTARTIKISPSWRVLTEAELIDYASGRTARKIDLISVMKEALAGNLNVKALELALSAGAASVRGSRASLLPNISASSTARTIDKDGALFAPQHLWNGKISATQVLWSEQAWAGYSVQKLAQKSRKYELVTGKLDVLGDVAVAYLNVVRAKTVVRIQHDNLKATRANLEAARAQFDAGASSKADVYRWDSQIANARKALIDASASRNIAEISLQQILNRPPEERFETTDELSQPQAIELLQGIERYLNNPSTFRLFRQFLIAEAVRRSPEIQQLDAAIAVQVRLEKSAKRALYSPTLSATGSVSQRFYRGGASSTQAVPNGTDWFLGLTLSVPIYEGGRYAEIDRNSLEVSRLQAQRLNIENSISQRAATRLHQMGASFAGIGLGREAAEAAKENYKLVAAAYAEGAVRIVDVIDAQNAWFTSDSRAADSVYVFLIDWMNVQRAVGHFTTLMEKSELQVLINRVDAYIAQEKQAP